ncbi:MAG TPA: CHAT domain-containing protein [Thermoanaerobaculia bacterium]
MCGKELKELFTSSVVQGLLVGLLVLFGDAPDSSGLRATAEELIAAFRAGQVEQILALWSPSAPTRAADRRRLSRLMEDRLELDVSIIDVLEEPGRGLVQMEVLRKGSPAIRLEQYKLEFNLEDGQWRVSSLKSSEADRVAQLLEATPEQRDPLMKANAPTVPLARELLQRGAESLDTGRIPQSAPALMLAADIAERTGDDSTRAAALRALGRLDSARGEFAAAAGHYESSLKLSESSGDQRGVAKALNGLASVDRVKGDLARAENRWNAALDIFKQTGDKAGQARMLSNVGTLHNLQGDYGGAKARLEESLRIYQELNDLVGRSIVLNNLGIVYRGQGAYREALQYFQQSLELSRQTDDLDGVAKALGNLGNVFTGQGDYMKALDAYQQSLALNERLGNLAAVAGALSGIANVYATLGNYAQSLEYLQKSYALAERTGFKEGMAFSLHNIGGVWSRQGDLRRGLEYYQKSLAAETELGNKSDMAINLSDIGKTHALLGNREEARKSFEKSLEIAQQINDRQTSVLVLVNLAELARRPDEYAWGLDFAQRAMKISTEIGLPEKLWEAHLVLGRVYRRMGRLDEAGTEVQSAIAIVEQMRRGIPGEQLAQQAFESMVAPYHEMVDILAARGEPAAAFEYAERAKGRVLLDVLRQGRSDVSGAMTDAERAQEEQLVARLAQLNRELHQRPRGGQPNADRMAEVRSKLQSARLEYEAFLTGLYAAHPQLRVERGEMSPVRASELGELLRQGAADAFIEFVVTADATHVFVVSRRGGAGIRARTIAIGRKKLDDEVTQFRERLAGRDLTYAPAARALFEKLIQPIDGSLRDAKQICIVPDGPLWELPFQALQPAAGRFFLDRHAIFYAPSLTVLRETLAKKKAHGLAARLLAFGNPVVPSEVASQVQSAYRDASLGPLPHAETEVRRIASLYGPQESRVHVREEAREELVKSEARTFNVLHFATHGILDDESPLYSRLLFSRPTSAAEDGVLEAREIMRLNLDADLAVLSACETGRGRVGAGEGLIGISWAFFVAGCPTSVVSQWKVSSASTTELMIEFHRALRSVSPPARTRAEALRHAALKVRSSPAYHHPFYWAAFVLVGDGQ